MVSLRSKEFNIIKVILSLVASLFLGWYFFYWQSTAYAPNSAPLISENFDNHLPSALGRAIINHRHTQLAPQSGIEGSTAIKVHYIGDERGSKRVVTSAAFAPTTQATLSFGVKFCDNFDFARGGKLHGLGSDKPVSGGNAVTDDRWSARLMWRRNGGLMTYIYHQNMKGKYGDTRVAADFRFTPGQYHLVEMNVMLNTQPDKADGLVKVSVDGMPLIEHKGLRFRSTDSTAGLIQTLMFSTFHGGSSPDWAPRNEDGSFKTDCAYFDDFQVTELKVTPTQSEPAKS